LFSRDEIPNATEKIMRRFSMPAFLIVLAALAADVSSVAGQVTPSVMPGSRVRLSAPSLGLSEAVGTVKEATDEALVVQFEYPRRVGTVDRSEIGKLDISIERERKVLKSLGVGLLIGASSGAVIGLASGDDQNCFICFTAEEKALVGGAMLGLTGGVVGLFVGLARPQEIWSPMLPEDVDLTVLPLVGDGGPGLHVGFGLRFN
jgi:hypothetical protein